MEFIRDKLKPENFDDLIHEVFSVTMDDGSKRDLALIQVKRIASKNNDNEAFPVREGGAFSLKFYGQQSGDFRQGTVEVNHPNLSEPLQLFMCALGPRVDDKDNWDYLVAFN